MSIFGAIASAVVGKAVSKIFEGDSKSTSGQPAVTYVTPEQPTGLLARSVQSGRQASITDGGVRTSFRGASPEGSPKGLKAVDPRFVSSETAFWGGLISRAINQAQTTLPASKKEQHGIFRR